MSILIIAEAGVNHNGSIETAGQLIETAAEAGPTWSSSDLLCRPIGDRLRARRITSWRPPPPASLSTR